MNTDVRLSGISLDLIDVGGALKFTGLNVANPTGPPSRWAFLDGPQEFANSAVNHIGGAAIPGLSGDGVGPGSTAGTNVLLASISYMPTFLSGVANLRLRIGGNGVADFSGNFPQVRFGTTTAPLVNGDAIGSDGNVGTVIFFDCCGGLPPVISSVNLGEVGPTMPIVTQLTAASNFAVGWSNLTPTVGTPARAAILSPTGQFSWDPTGSMRGTKGSGVPYSWTATASNGIGTDTRVAISLRLVPEPSAMVLFGLALILGAAVKRSR